MTLINIVIKKLVLIISYSLSIMILKLTLKLERESFLLGGPLTLLPPCSSAPATTLNSESDTEKLLSNKMFSPTSQIFPRLLAEMLMIEA